MRIEDVRKVGHQQIGNDKADFGRDKARSAADSNLLDVLPFLNRINDGGVGGRPANAALFQFLNQRRFVKTWPRLGGMLLQAAESASDEGLPICQCGQTVL